jgi:hypothetical protein
MKRKAFFFLIVFGFLSTHVYAVDELGTYSCVGKKLLGKSFTGTKAYNPNGDKKSAPLDNFSLENVKATKPTKGCYYGVVDAGLVTLPKDSPYVGENCFFIFVDEKFSAKARFKKDAYNVQCRLHSKPDTRLYSGGGGVDLKYRKEHKAFATNWWQGAFTQAATGRDGLGVCVGAAVPGEGGYGENDHMFCEFIVPEKDANGKKLRAATINFNLTPAAAKKTGSTESDNLKSNNPADKLKKKFKF